MNTKFKYLAAACLAATFTGWNAADAQQPPIRVGFLSSFTGPANQSGVNGWAGARMAVKEINDKGGIMGRQIELVSGDDASDPTQGVTEARRLVQRERVQFVLGPIASQITLAVAPILKEAKIGSMSVTGASAMNPEVGPYHFSMLTSADIQGLAIAQFLERSAKSVAVIHDPGTQNVSIVEALKRELPTKGVKITGIETYDPSSTDLTPQLLSLRRGNPDTLVALPGTGNDAGYMLKNRLDINWNIRIVGGVAITSQQGVTLKIAGADGYKNVVAINYTAQTYCSNDPVGQSDYVKYLERLKAFEPANYAKLSPLVAAYIYDGVYAMKAGMEGAKSTDGPAIAAWLEQNASKLKVTLGNLSASKTNHFLLSVSAMTFAENPDKLRSDGLMKRSGC